MAGFRWILLTCLAAVAVVSHMTEAAPQDGDLQNGDRFETNPLSDSNGIISEDDMSEDDLNELAEEIADQITMGDDGGSARATTFGKLFKGGMKKVGKGFKKVGKTVGKGFKKVGKGARKGLLKFGKVAGKGIQKAGKKTKQFATAKGKKIWGSLKKNMNGELGQAAKQLLMTVGNELVEQGMSLAVEAVAPMIIEYVMDKTQEGLCKCEGTTCSCCVQPPGFENACLEVKIKPVMKIMNAAITYNGEKKATLVISKEEGEGACARPSGVARFIEACITPIGIAEFEGGFRGCLSINLEPLSLERSMCIDFKGTRKDGTASFVPVGELDAIEMEAEQEEEDPNQNEEEDYE